MIHLVLEGGNKDLKNRKWVLPDELRKHLETVKKNSRKENLTSNPTTKEAYDHLEYILGLEHGIDYNEMKRIKNWFSNNSSASKTKQYELYGGDRMGLWVTNALETAIKNAKNNKNKGNVPNLEDTRDKTKVMALDDKTPTYDPKEFKKLKRLRNLSNTNESRTIILNESQAEQISKMIFINNNTL